MPGPRLLALELSAAEQEALEVLVRRHTTAQQIARRGRIVLLAAAGENNSEIARRLSLDVDTVRAWRARWCTLQALRVADLSVEARLADLPRSGRRTEITAEQVVKIVALACEAPPESGRPITQWTGREIAKEVMRRGTARDDFPPARLSAAKKGDLKPHRVRYWLTPPERDADFDATVAHLCTLYHEAPARTEQGERVISTDELSGVQALERLYPNLPMRAGQVERREFEYIRHGTASFLLSRDVASGEVVAPSAGRTRTEVDFLAHVQAVVATDPEALRWHLVLDNLNIHGSESLVRWVAAESGLEIGLGEKGKRGVSLHAEA